MKRFIRTIAVLMAVLMVLSAAAVVSGSAITVEKDGVTYFLNTRTPTTGDINALVVRLGFADYSVDDEDDPADSEETLLSYFDGTDDNSIITYYENASYGKLRLHCDTVYSYEAVYERKEYDEENNEAASNPEGLITETLNALQDEIGDIDRYDSNDDGYLDFVVFDFAGPMGGWSTTWWPHVNRTDDVEVLGKHIAPYSILRGDISTFTHEFGHIIGAEDYYSYMDGHTNNIMTYDMMSRDIGDHNGFTKWTYGWIEDDQIAYVDKNTGDTTVELTPIETTENGKKIAVVAPSIDRASGFFGEYFLVEYDSGEKNSKQVFEEHDLVPGFRIFHVNAKTNYMEEGGLIGYTTDNVDSRNCLIHNMKNEADAPSQWLFDNSFFKEGDSLTPEGYPNTGLSVDDVYNGLFTGISFTDFVTGEKPSFKVSFTDEQKPSEKPTLSLEYDKLDSQMKMTVVSDEPIIINESRTRDQIPYLLAQNGSKLMLLLTNNSKTPYRYDLRYEGSFPTIEPDAEYTLVIPEGCFKYGYNESAPEFRQMVTTDHFSAAITIAALPSNDGKYIYTNIFQVSDTIFGRVDVPTFGEGKMRFVEYNLQGEPIAAREFDLPDYDTSSPVYRSKAYRLNDGNYALEIFTMSNTYFVKIDGKGNVLSDVFTLSEKLLTDNGYTDAIVQVDFDALKNGLTTRLFSQTQRKYIYLTVDFENEPKVELSDSGFKYISIDSDTYIIRYYDGESNQNVLSVYDANDQLIGEVKTSATVFNVFADGENFVVQSYSFHGKELSNHVDTYTKYGELIDHVDVTEEFSHISVKDQITGGASNENGYYIIHTTRTDKTVFAYDRNWHYIEEFSIGVNADPIFVGVCGLTEKTELLTGMKMAQLVYRFNSGEFETEPVRLLGDANLDSVVDIMDATTVQRYDCKMIELSDDAELTADVDRDGVADIVDQTWIQRYNAGMKAPEGIGKPAADLSGEVLPMV